jgi:hypothetical protein
MKHDILIAITGFAVGAGVSFLVTRKLLDVKYAEFAQEEIESVKSQFARRQSKNNSEPKGEEGGHLTVHSSLEGTRTNEYNSVKQNYNRIGQQEEDEVDMDEAEEDESINCDHPYVIDDESFCNEFLKHDKLSITYYVEDNVLVDDNEEIVDDVDGLVGYENLSIMSTGMVNPNIIHIRNERIATDFEIAVNPNSYQEIVLGMSLDPKQRREISSRRRMEGFSG